jgi:AhpD family alkylhydroperoxidase
MPPTSWRSTPSTSRSRPDLGPQRPGEKIDRLGTRRAVPRAVSPPQEADMTDPREPATPQEAWRRMRATRGHEALMPYHRMLHRVDDGFLDAYNRWYEAVMLPPGPRAISPEVRELIVIACCAATREQTGIRLHAERARRLGVTPREILECVTFAAITSGMPAMRDAMATLAEAIPELAPPPDE